METITSPQNPRLKLVRRIATRRGRLREGAFAVEGEDLVAAGLQAAWPIRELLCNADEPLPEEFGTLLQQPQVSLVPGPLLASVAGLAHPPRVLGVFELPQDVAFERPGRELRVDVDAQIAPVTSGAGVYLDGIRDPGNVGSVLRSARAFGIGTILLGPYTADPFSPKATRASMGAIFTVSCRFIASIDDVLGAYNPVVALDARSTTPLYDVDLTGSPLLCIGSERTGLTAEVQAAATTIASIPQGPGIDSLNAAAVAAIALYEARRQQVDR